MSGVKSKPEVNNTNVEAPPGSQPSIGQPSVTGSDRYLNREYSWLQFNRRVLDEAACDEHPLLERLKFLAIFESNLDEFYMVRVSGLIEQYEAGILDTPPDGLTPNEQLSMISETAFPLREKAGQLFDQVIHPALKREGIAIRRYNELTDRQQNELDAIFHEDIFPLLTPLMLQPAPNLPFISSRSLNLAVEILDEAGDTCLARVKVPSVTPRAIRLPRKKNDFILLEDLIAANLDALFPGVKIVGSYRFRVVRDADIEIRELDAADLITTIEQTIKLRRFGDPVLLETEATMPPNIRSFLMKMLKLEETDALITEGILGFEVFWEIAAIDKPNLRFSPHHPYLQDSLGNSEGLFEQTRRAPFLVHQPYDSFRSVEAFVASAATDPNVVGIKQTLYRVGSESPIVESLLAAAGADKQVAAMVELKARFDESNNLVWARELEQAGVHVTYGFPDMKTHCKLCLVVRREGDALRSYAHIGTGNYNPATARLYTDLGLFTSDPAITQDISELFNYLTGFSRQREYRKLLVAPLNLREGILDRIRREIGLHKKYGGGGHIIFKLNALVDPEVIEALYDASEAGVQVDLIVRGVCCLRPGVTGMSDNIRVTSVVGRFLEHSRVYYFHHGQHPEALIGSADMMRRNLDRRIEVLVPITEPKLVEALRETLDVYLLDNVKAWILNPDGSYSRPKKKGPRVNAQETLIANPLSRKLVAGK